MFETFCADFAFRHNLTSILMKEISTKNYGHEKLGKAEWYFFKESNGAFFPVHLSFTTAFSKSRNRKEVLFDVEIPFLTKEIFDLIKQFIKELSPFFITYFSSFDPDRLKKVTLGKTYDDISFFYNKNFLAHREFLKNIDEPLKDDVLFSLVEKTAEILLSSHEHNKLGEKENYLIVHGENGLAFKNALLSRRLCKAVKITESAFALELFFPFAKSAKKRNLTDVVLSDNSFCFLSKAGIVYSTASKEKLESYHLFL